MISIHEEIMNEIGLLDLFDNLLLYDNGLLNHKSLTTTTSSSSSHTTPDTSTNTPPTTQTPTLSLSLLCLLCSQVFLSSIP
jgi:hypothetical protein